MKHECDGRILLEDQERGLSRSVALRFHLLVCEQCRKANERYEGTVRELHRYTPYPVPRDQLPDIMARLRLISEAELRGTPRVTLSTWILMGMLLLLGFLVLQFSAPHHWLRGYMGRSLEIPLNIAMGVVVSAYAALFIGSHLDDFSQRFGIRK